MNNWICTKCNTANTGNFCQNCGEREDFNVQQADLPPTVIGLMPPQIQPPQMPPNQFQPPQMPPNQPPPFPPNQPAQFSPPPFQPPPPFAQPQMLPVAPLNSSKKKIAVIGSIVGLIVVIAGGVALWFAVIGPYFKEQALLKKESDDQIRANSTTAISLLFEEDRTFRKSKTIDKMQLLQASQNLPPELKSELSNINDAAAAEYVKMTDSNQKVSLQIFKYNSPDQAAAVCDKVGQALEKLEKDKGAVNVIMYVPSNNSSACKVMAEDKNKIMTDIVTRYGFLIIASGHTNNYPSNLSSKAHYTLVK